MTAARGRLLRAASTPTARTRKASSTSGPRPRSTRLLGDARRLVQAILRRDRRRAIGKATPSSTGSSQPELADEDDRGRARRSAAQLLLAGARSRGCGPGCDDKVLADWNGLMIAALAEAGLVFDRPEWIDAGARAPSPSSASKMTGDGRPAAAQLARRAGRATRRASTITPICAAPRWPCTRRPATTVYLAQARDWVAVLDRHYWDNDGGGYFFAADDTTDLIARAKTAADAAVPAGNGTMVGVLARLDLLTGDEPIAAAPRRSSAPFRARSRAISSRSRRCSTTPNSRRSRCRSCSPAIRTIPLSPRCAARCTGSHCRTASCSRSARRSVAGRPSGSRQGLVDGKPAAYVCEGPVCSLPLTDPQALPAALAEVR